MGSFEGAHKAAAARLGISYEDYIRHVDADEQWCYQCKRWRDAVHFRRRWAYASPLASHCIDCHRDYMRVYMRRRYHERKAVS